MKRLIKSGGRGLAVSGRSGVFPSNLIRSPYLINFGGVFRKNYDFANNEVALLKNS
jgi:hypothetical protein